MFFPKLFLLIAAIVYPVLATITILSPGPQNPWAQFKTNAVTWNFAQGDPALFDIYVEINNNGSFVPFAIAQNVPTGNGSEFISNVTLNQASGYEITFVNGSNANQVFATSQAFSVEPNTTVLPPVPQPGSNPNSSTTGNSTTNGTSGTSSFSSASSSSSSSASSSASQSSAASALRATFTFGPALTAVLFTIALGAASTLVIL